MEYETLGGSVESTTRKQNVMGYGPLALSLLLVADKRKLPANIAGKFLTRAASATYIMSAKKMAAKCSAPNEELQGPLLLHRATEHNI